MAWLSSTVFVATARNPNTIDGSAQAMVLTLRTLLTGTEAMSLTKYRPSKWAVRALGPGCCELRNGRQLVLYGMGGHVAARMTSLLPGASGAGTRNNKRKKAYVRRNLRKIEYRTVAFATRADAAAFERDDLRAKQYLFPT